MGFTVRFTLGVVLVLTCCWSSETTVRLIRQVQTNGKDERTTEQSVAANLTEETNNKPKTDPSTEDNKTIEKQNSISKLQKSESYKKATNQPEIKTIRDEITRSIDIEKYVSKEFHNKNNVYTVSTSPDNEKFVEPDYSYHPTTQQEDHTKEFHFNTELTTPKNNFFDHKYQEAVESVEQKLENIDDSHELSLESDSKENLNLEKLYDETQNNDTKANLSYINYKNIIRNDTNGKNAVHRDLVVEAGTNLDFRSSYNETVIDDDDNGNITAGKEPTREDHVEPVIPNSLHSREDQDRSESSTIKSIILTTRKSLVLTKPPSNKNSSHISILSNNIETETVKAINPVQSNSLTTTEKTKGEQERTEEYTLHNPIEIVKRGKVKFGDHTSTQTPMIMNEVNNKSEQLLQENQLVPVHVHPPPSTEKVPESTTSATTEEQVSTTSTVNYVTTTESTTTEARSVTSSTTVTATETTSLPEITTIAELENTTIAEGDVVDLVTTTESAQTTTQDATTDEIPTTIVNPSAKESLVKKEDSLSTTDLNKDMIPTTTESITIIDISVTEPIKDMASSTSTTTSTTLNSDLDRNPTTTTENGMRTSKGIVFRETVPTTALPVTTTEVVVIPTTQPIESTTEMTTITFKIQRSQSDEPPSVTTTTEANFITFENRTNSTPETKPEPNDTTTEPENVTDGSATLSDSFNTIPPDDNSGTIAAITISSIGAVCLILLAGLLVIMRKRQKRFNYGQRCTPVSLGHYSIDNVPTYKSGRRKGDLRDSKRSYRNLAFEDPSAISHPLNFPALGKFINNAEDMKAEFEEIPQITARTNELPEGCDIKNRYANVIPLPETRVALAYIDGYPNSDYINANYVTGPKNVKGYYIACQGPMQNTVDDFWRMVWEQQSKVILMLTYLFENGVEKCFDYLPPSEVLDCHRAFGDFLVTLKKREVKDKYIISTLQLKNMVSSCWREVTHFWYLGWPEKGVPSEANSLIAFLIEARSYMKSSSLDRKNIINSNSLTNGTAKNELNPVVVHCSPGTGRTGVVIACDIAIREFEQTRLVDIPRIVYKIRRDRASAVQTKEQYAFIYKVVNLYATKLTGDALDSF